MTRLLVISSAALSVAAAVPYIIMTLRGVAKPRPASWAIWAGILAIAAAAAAETGQVPAAAYSSICTVENGLIAVLALRIPRHLRDRPMWVPLPSGRKARLDWFCVAGASVGLVLLALVRAPAAAVAATIATDLLAYIPTAVNAWRNPRDEFWPTYVLYAAAAFLVLAAAWLPFFRGRGLPAFTAVAFPIWLVAVDGGAGLMIVLRAARQPAALGDGPRLAVRADREALPAALAAGCQRPGPACAPEAREAREAAAGPRRDRREAGGGLRRGRSRPARVQPC